MITLPNGKICMNEQEAIQWLLDNYPIPFQCSANYVGGAEIGLGTIVNPTPAKVKVGSIIFFADSKVSTVVAVNSNSFICSEQYNDLVDDVVYVSNVQLNASGHLIVTLSNGTNIDAGLIKQVSSFSIDASQHLIATYNDGTSSDLGAIFSGNITISGDFAVTGKAKILENIYDSQGHPRFIDWAGNPMTSIGFTSLYCKASLAGTHLMMVLAGTFESGANVPASTWASFGMASWISDKVFPVFGGSRIEIKEVKLYNDDWSTEGTSPSIVLTKYSDRLEFVNLTPLTTTKARAFRVQFDLLIDNN